MSMDDSRRRGLLRLKHTREVSEAKAEAMADQAPRFARLADPSASPRVVSSFNLFQTPEALADLAAGILIDGRADLGRILEPSAGLGRLYQAIRRRSSASITLVDISPDCCRELYHATETDSAARLIAGDFLGMDQDRLGGPFDSILMNPPFKMGTDVRHVRHALAMLGAGGRLVSFVAAGPRQRAAFEQSATAWIDLPAGSFRAEGTNVDTALVVFDR